jgi:hypothetical protein
MKDNTRVRIRVPKSLYESIQNELSKKKESGEMGAEMATKGIKEDESVNEYVGMSPDQVQVAEILGQLIAAGGLSLGVKTALKMALDKIKSKKSSAPEKGAEPEASMEEEYDMKEARFNSKVDIRSAIYDLMKNGETDQEKLDIVTALASLSSQIAKHITNRPKNYISNNPKKAVDMAPVDSLMEAIKKVAEKKKADKKKAEDKKKADEKKKKMMEDKKKKEMEDKKKKEAEAKKKAAAKKK